MKNTKRVLSAVLAVVMLVLAFPVIALPTVAAEVEMEQEATYMDYKDMYVQDGLTILLDAYDPSNVDLANGTWASEVGSVVATIKGGVYGDSNKTGWQTGDKGIYWKQYHSISGNSTSYANGVYFSIEELPHGDFTVENVMVNEGIINDDGTGWASVWTDGSDASKEVFTGASTTGQYGCAISDSFVYGPVRNIAFNNFAHTTYKNGVENISTDKRSMRWYYTGLAYTNHSTNFKNAEDRDGDGEKENYVYGVTLNANETAHATYDLDDIYTYATTYDLIGGDAYNTATSAQITNWHNGATTFSATVTPGQITGIYEDTLLPYNAGYVKGGDANADNARFNIMKGLAGSLYSIRVYDKALTAGEMAMNHLADLCAYYEIEVPVLPGNFTYATVADSYKAVALGSLDEAGVAALQAAINGYASSLDYAQLYVQDGLNLLLMAYNDSVSTANVAGGTWVNLVGNENGTIVDTSDTLSWVANDAANGGGISYYYKSADEYKNNRSALGLTLPASAIGNGDATVEALFIPHYITDDNGVIVPHSNSVGGTYGLYHGAHSSFTFGEINMPFFQPSIYHDASAGYSGSSAGFRLHTGIGGGTEAIGSIGVVQYDNHKLLGKYDVVTDGSHNVIVSDKTRSDDDTIIDKTVKDTLVKHTTSMVVVRDVNDDNTFSATVTMDITNTLSKNFPADQKATIDQCKYPFDMFYTFAATVYAIRAYDRVLTADEIANNRVVDIIAKANADISELLALDESAREVILFTCASELTYTMSAEDVQAVLDDKLATTFVPDTSKDAYSDLYVQDGLLALYTAFDGGEKTVDLANGIWYATGSDAFITLKGDRWVKSNGGIGYRMLPSEWSKTSSTDYIDLGSLTSNEFTVEVAQTLIGLTDENGNRVTTDGNVDTDHKWGYYATEYSSYEFGYFKGTSFVANVTTAGGGVFATRVSFNPGHWGIDNGKYWIGGANFSWANEKYATVPTTLAFTQEAGIFELKDVPVYAYENREKVAEEERGAIEGVLYSHTLPGYKLSIYSNGNVETSADTVTGASDTRYNRPITYVDAEGAQQTGYIPYLSASEANASSIGKSMKVMSSLPGDVYAIRVYDRALSAEETLLNTVIDIAAYTKADVSVLASYSQKQLLTIASAGKALTYESTAEDVENAIAAGIALLGEYAPDAVGYQKGTDNTSLRIWAKVDETIMGSATMLGMVIEVTGDAEKTLSGETEWVYLAIKGGATTYVTAAEGEAFYAAVVNGIPAEGNFTFTITPYAVVDGVRVYGEAKTLTWPAVE